MQRFILYYAWLISIGISLAAAQAQPFTDVEDLPVCQQFARDISILKLGNENLKLRLDMMDLHFERQQQHQHDVQREFRTMVEIIQKLHNRLVEKEDNRHREIKELLIFVAAGKDCKREKQENFIVDTEKAELLKEMQNISKLQEEIVVKLDTKCPADSIQIGSGILANGKNNVNATEVVGLNVCSGIYTKMLGEISSNMTILKNIDSKLTKLNEQYAEESEKHKKSIAISHGLLKFLNNKDEPKICVRSNDQQLVCTANPYPTSCSDYDPSHCSNRKCHIKNPLYGTESFLVSCDNDSDGGGWTVIQRRINGSVDFYRGWSEYKTGFGNIDGEFWIGLDKLYALTTTLAPMELLIQLKDHNDTMKYAKYGKFSIGSELELYELKEAEEYMGNAGDSLSNHKGYKFTTKDKDNDISKRYNCAVARRGAWWYRSCQMSNLNGVYYKTGLVPEKELGEGINWGTFWGYNYSMKFVQMMIRPSKK